MQVVRKRLGEGPWASARRHTELRDIMSEESRADRGMTVVAAPWLGHGPPYQVRVSQVRGHRRFLQGGSLLSWLNLECGSTRKQDLK